MARSDSSCLKAKNGGKFNISHDQSHDKETLPKDTTYLKYKNHVMLNKKEIDDDPWELTSTLRNFNSKIVWDNDNDHTSTNLSEMSGFNPSSMKLDMDLENVWQDEKLRSKYLTDSIISIQSNHLSREGYLHKHKDKNKENNTRGHISTSNIENVLS